MIHKAFREWQRKIQYRRSKSESAANHGVLSQKAFDRCRKNCLQRGQNPPFRRNTRFAQINKISKCRISRVEHGDLPLQLLRIPAIVLIAEEDRIISCQTIISQSS